jgi:hypothetical protein
MGCRKNNIFIGGIRMSSFHSRSCAIMLLSATVLFASPKISFDKTVFQCGSVAEGKVDKLQAHFTVKNSGDAVLKISARPGCGCTVVKYDSLIQPGKTSVIESEVTIKGYHSGPISKAITVTSNDSITSVIRLEIQAKVQGLIDVSEQYISFSAAHPDSFHTITLSSQKKDLKVTEVTFKINSQENGPDWQKNPSIPIPFKWIAVSSADADGYRVNSLKLYPPKIDKTESGEVTIKTNHPEKPEITVPGNITK